jgi:hypothetical protein
MTYLGLKSATAAIVAAGLLAVTATHADAQWRYRHGWHHGGWGGGGAVAAGVVGGLALGALAAGAARPYYYPEPVYAAPPPPPGACWYEPEDVWNGYNWVRHRVRVCQ